MTTENLPDVWVFGEIEKRKDFARNVLQCVFEILGVPNSFLDVGGGAGSWCAVAKGLGVQRVRLLDACPPSQVLPELTQEEQVQVNLEAGIPDQGKFDLVICIEVIEHLSDEAAERLVKQITNSTNFVLFSAAIPGQGGIGHINERMHDFWHHRFSQYGFEKYDVLRPILVSRADVSAVHRQNLFIYARIGHGNALVDLPQICDDIELIRTEHLKALYIKDPIDLRSALRAIPSAVMASLRRRVGKS